MRVTSIQPRITTQHVLKSNKIQQSPNFQGKGGTIGAAVGAATALAIVLCNPVGVVVGAWSVISGAVVGGLYGDHLESE